MEASFDTIAAISTPIGIGGLGVIRVSGKDAVLVVDRIFCAANKQTLADAMTHTVHYGHICTVREKKILDEVLVTVMRAPRTFTAEDVVEISTHGSPLLMRRVLEELLEAGARLAQPGEFTRRAFVNGRIDLTQAEAVMDIIQADSDAAISSAISHLEGGLHEKIEQIRRPLIYLSAQFAAAVDYPDDDIADLSEEGLREALTQAVAQCESLLATKEEGIIAKEGILCAIVGRPNVGKSSLLNALTGTERAIVTEIAGTTRDVIEQPIILDQVALRLVDTAGIRQTEDMVEQLGVERSRQYIESAQLLLLLLDASMPLTEEDRELLAYTEKKKRIIIWNKSDLVKGSDGIQHIILPGGDVTLSVSTKTKEGLQQLRQAIIAVCGVEKLSAESIMLSNLRHIKAVEGAVVSLREAISTLDAGMPVDMCFIDLSAAIQQLGQITGESVSADIVDEIFANFCVGK